MKQVEQTQIRQKVLIPLAVMIVAMLSSTAQLIYWFATDHRDGATFHQSALTMAAMILLGVIGMMGFFYFYLGRVQRRLQELYREQCMEIMRRRFAEVQLSEAKGRAEQANMAKSQFLSNMSHELRTPLNAVVGFSDLLKDESLNDEQMDYVSTIAASSHHLLSLINDLLDLSKIEAGKMDIVQNTGSIRNLVQQIDSMMRQQIESKGLAFEISVDPALPKVFTTDQRHLSQCLINLVNNAKKFTEEGSIRLSVGLVQIDGTDQIRFDVTDTGIGIPADKQRAVFESFVQADSTTTRKYGGTGLGLPISVQLINMLGGQLTMQSEPGVGSTFTITLPLTVPAEQMQPA